MTTALHITIVYLLFGMAGWIRLCLVWGWPHPLGLFRESLLIALCWPLVVDVIIDPSKVKDYDDE